MSTTKTPATASTAPLNAWTKPRRDIGDVSAISHLFQRLEGKYPGQWRRQFPTQANVENWESEWVSEFFRLGITFAEVSKGLDNCPERFPPTLQQFIAACRPQIDLEQAFHEAVDQLQRRSCAKNFIAQYPGRALPEFAKDSWSSPVVYWAATRLGNDMNTQPYVNMKGRWAQAIAAAQRDIGKGIIPNFVPDSVPAIEAPGKQLTPKTVARQKLSELVAKFCGDELRAA